MNINPPVPDKVVAIPGTSKPLPSKASVERRPSFVPSGPPSKMRSHIVAFIGEFVGTFLFLFFAYAGTSIANSSPGAAQPLVGPTTSVLLYIALAFGFSLAVNAWVFFRISGGLFNPAVTCGLMLIGCLTYTRAAIVFVAQMLGALASAGVVSALFPGAFIVATTLAPGTSVVRGVFIEMFLTFELVFTIFMLAAEKHRATYLAPIGIGLCLFTCEMAGVAYTGGSLNPARSFAPHVIMASFPTYHWIYWVGPALGALVAVFFYRFMKALEYEVYGATGQDSDRVAAPAAPRTDGSVDGHDFGSINARGPEARSMV